jgi:integrase
LKRDDVDLEDGPLQVRRTLTITKDVPVFTSPKTAASRRSVKLTSKAIETLRHYPERQPREINTIGSLWSENGLMFSSGTGEPLNRHNLIRRSFKPLLKRAGLPQIRFHDLRHTCATLLLAKNVNPKVVSEMLGHSSIAITLDTYSHVLTNMQSEAAKAMGDTLT